MGTICKFQSETYRYHMLGVTRRRVFCDVSDLVSTCIVNESVHLLRSFSMIVGPFLVIAVHRSVNCRLRPVPANDILPLANRLDVSGKCHTTAEAYVTDTLMSAVKTVAALRKVA